MADPDGTRRTSLNAALTAVGAGLPVLVVAIAVLSVPLAASDALGLDDAQRAGWIVALYGVAAAISIVLSWRVRQPLAFTGNILAIVFFASLGAQWTYAELIGATVVAGGIVTVLGVTGLTARVGRWVPEAVVLGLLAGIVTPFIVDAFSAVGDAPWMMGGFVASYLASRALLPARVPPVLPALAVGLLLAGPTGQLGIAPTLRPPPLPALTMPAFDGLAIASIAPVLVVFMTVQANLPSMVFLRAQGYAPPVRAIESASGIGTMLASLLGPACLSVSMMATSLTASPGAGPRGTRYLSVLFVSVGALIVAALAGTASALVAWMPLELLFGVAGLALVDVLVAALRDIMKGADRVGPVFAFVIALSDLTLVGFGPAFWAFVVGLAVTFAVDRRRGTLPRAA